MNTLEAFLPPETHISSSSTSNKTLVYPEACNSEFTWFERVLLIYQ